MTNDTDLVEPWSSVRVVTQGSGLPVTLLTPVARPATSMARVASYIRHVALYLGACRAPDPVQFTTRKTVAKPAAW